MMRVLAGFWRKGYFYILLAGIFLVVFLLDPHIGIYDWGKEMSYFNLIKISLAQYRSLPLFWWNPQSYSGYPAISVSSFFLANPETFAFSPFVLLLFWLDTLFFMKLLVCAFCAIGIIGILRLSRKLNWQDGQRRIFLALFLFSPIVIQHIAIGYFPWLNLYLFPWLVLFLVEEGFLKRVLGCASVLALILLQGGVHPFVWFVIFIGFYAFVRFIQKPGWRFILFMVALIILTTLLSLVRISTSAQTFADFKQGFFNGYSLNGFITWGLTPPVFTPADMDDIEPYIESYNNGVPYWDGAIYWGAVLPLVIILFIVLVDKRIFQKAEPGDSPDVPLFSIAMASFLITLLSFGNLYQNLISGIASWIRIPSLEAMEKYPFRFAILGYFGFGLVISHYYPEILITLKRPIQFLSKYLAGQKKKPFKMGNYGVFKWLLIALIIISVLFLTSFLIRGLFFTWLEPAIQSAYRGEANAWLADLMSQRAFIPVMAYLQKAYSLYAGIQNILRIGLLFGWGIYLVLRFSKPLADFLFPIFESLHKNMGVLLEVILVIPLLFASAMWMRVALATPIKGPLPVDLIAPQIEVQPLSPFTLTATPSQLSILLEKPMGNQAILLSGIKYSDRRFLQIGDPKMQWFDGNGFLGLTSENDPLIVIKVNPESYQTALWVTWAAWVFVIGFAGMLSYQEKSRNRLGYRS